MSLTTLFPPHTLLHWRNPTLSPPPPHALNSSSCKPYKLLLRPHTLRLAAAAGKAPAYESGGHTQPQTRNSLDDLLSVTELACVVSPAIVAVGYALHCTFLSSKRAALGVIASSRAFAWAAAVMASGVALGSWIRRRQWRRISVARRGGPESVNLVERIERLEEEVKSSATVIRVLSRQLEKLGTRFRVTRRALKDPIEETAALAKKNSEATRALAIQEDILEKELGEIQNVLIAMQEQQQKQFELIVAIGKTGKLWNKWEPNQKEHPTPISKEPNEEQQYPIHMSQKPNQEQHRIQISDLKENVKQFEVESSQSQSSGASAGSDNERP
ncbi:hypothetical protein Tsubulata_001273 [Turnera subulata]|uniref:Uncharacterized protein n=1 Tax=Turnera subulata TaxID=218843 RepID=A0A9Q0FNP2_9ROSI|nr:hypothetical protein Tsubulata_001273 [Turnera subulata]